MDDTSQRLAELKRQRDNLDRKIDRSTWILTGLDVTVIVIALSLAAIQVIARPVIPRWEMVAWLGIAAIGALGNVFAQRTIRSCRAQIRDLRDAWHGGQPIDPRRNYR